jgi:hypothetical protein
MSREKLRKLHHMHTETLYSFTLHEPQLHSRACAKQHIQRLCCAFMHMSDVRFDVKRYRNLSFIFNLSRLLPRTAITTTVTPAPRHNCHHQRLCHAFHAHVRYAFWSVSREEIVFNLSHHCHHSPPVCRYQFIWYRLPDSGFPFWYLLLSDRSHFGNF